MASPVQSELRKWAVEQALAINRGQGQTDDMILTTAAKLEDYVSNGSKSES